MPEHDTPWIAGPWRIRDEDGPPLTDVMVGERLLATAYPEHYRRDRISEPAGAILRSYAEAEANARLIAAAPALYEACRQAAELFEDDQGIFQVLRAALALARGETNG